MPDLPIFVSSAKASAASVGNFEVNFQPALEIPSEAKSATVSVQQLTCPYNMPNVDASNNGLVVSVPSSNNTTFEADSTGAARRITISVPTGLYDVDSLQAAINRAVNQHPVVSPLLKVDSSSEHKVVNNDGSTGAAVAPDHEGDFLTLLPDYTANRLRIQL